MSRRPTVALPVILLLAACQTGGEQPADGTALEAAESVATGVRIAALPAFFEIASNDPEGLVLTAPALAGPNKVTITLSDVHPDGLNIIDAVEQALDNFNTLPAGQSFGQTQLVAPIGLTYMARGRYEVDGVGVEELKAMLAHPWGNRLLTIAYIYPVGTDTSDRGAQLMELLGEIEPLPAPPE